MSAPRKANSAAQYALVAGTIGLLVGLSVLTGWVFSAERRGVLGLEQSIALVALPGVLVFAALVWVNAAQLRRMDAERGRARKGLSASEERIRLILDSALDALVTIDHTGTITGWSPQAETLFGWSAGEALGRLLSETVIPERYRAQHTQGLERYLATGEGPLLNRRIEVSALRRDQSEFPMELAITPIRSGNRVSFSAFVRDLTERKRAEAALRESQELLERSEEHTSELQSQSNLVCRLLLEKKI